VAECHLHIAIGNNQFLELVPVTQPNSVDNDCLCIPL
jgi:hypothetical protein